MLVHHADPRRERVLRAANRGAPAAQLDLAAVGLVVPVENAHERRLAGAVLADDAVDCARVNDERDVAVRVHAAESFVDTPELDQRRGGRGGAGRHPARYFFAM